MPLGQLNLVKKYGGKPLRADQAGLPRICLPPRPKLNEAAVLRCCGAADGGGLQELTEEPCSEDHRRLPRSADLRRRKVDPFLHARSVPLRSVFPDAVQVNERRWLLAAMPRRGCLILGAARRTFCRRRQGLHFVMPNVRVKPAPTVGRQARAGENVPRTARPGLVARRWGSA